MNAAIRSIHARRVWDSRGRPTVEAEVGLQDGAMGRAIVPAGASKGTREALELRDGGARFAGLDVLRAVDNVNGEIARALLGMAADDQAALDAELIALDGTAAKTRLGANATLAVSMAAAHAAAASHGAAAVRIPRRTGGDAAADAADPDLRRRRARRPPRRCAGLHGRVPARPTLRRGAGVDRRGLSLRRANCCRNAAHAAAWRTRAAGGRRSTPTRRRSRRSCAAIERAGFVPGEDVAIALDIAASDFGREGRYTLGLESRELDSDGLIELLLRWIDRYPIASIEDPLGEDDPAGFARFTKAVGHRVQVVGDDFLVSHAPLVEQAAATGAANTVLLKPNQRGTLSETLQAWRAAQAAGYAGIVSARSGETEDTTIVHLAIGWQTGQLKVGSFARSERMAKWNEALRIEERLGDRARFAGPGAFGRNRP